MGDMDPEDTKSLDSSDGAVQAGEENHSSNSDMVHLEREEVEMLEEAEEAAEEEAEEEDELQSSVLSVLGGEKELVEMREEAKDLQAPETEGLLVSAEEPRREKAEFMQVVPPMALPPLPIVRLHPPSTTSTPVPSTTTSEVEEPYSAEGLHPPFILAPIIVESPEQLKFSQIPLSDVEELSTEASEAEIEKLEPLPLPKTTKPQSSSKRLFGGAALVAVVGVVAYGAIAFCRK